MDEIPFDFTRKRLSVVVRRGDERLLITKGEAESVFADLHVRERRRHSPAVRRDPAGPRGGDVPEAERRRLPDARGRGAGRWTQQDAYTVAAEHDMTLVGFAAFLDPPKEGIPAVLEALKQNGVSVVIMTGDNQYVTQKIARDVGLAADRIVTGTQVDAMDDAALAYQAENGAIFARVSPEQKNRVILALKARGHVVGLHRRRHQRRALAAHRGRRHLGR